MTGRRRRLVKARTAFGLAGFLLLAAGSHGQQQESPPPPQQPVPYSHKTHLALGLKCDSCHRNADPGEFMGFPAESFCMGCHQAIKVDSPHIQKVAAAASEKKPLPWVRVYQLPNYVYFSHRVHTAAGTACETCHGPVRERAVMTREVVHNMRSCMECHAAKKARSDCATCHEERH
jgi:c(7)-type cytochrome triheme protein